MYATNDSGTTQQIQEDIALDQRTDGFGDAYDGKALLPGMSFDYMRGFVQGMIQAHEEQKERIERFKEFVAREEAQRAGQVDWLDEVMSSNNDEPFLQFDCFDEF